MKRLNLDKRLTTCPHPLLKEVMVAPKRCEQNWTVHLDMLSPVHTPMHTVAHIDRFIRYFVYNSYKSLSHTGSSKKLLTYFQPYIGRPKFGFFWATLSSPGYFVTTLGLSSDIWPLWDCSACFGHWLFRAFWLIISFWGWFWTSLDLFGLYVIWIMPDFGPSLAFWVFLQLWGFWDPFLI